MKIEISRNELEDIVKALDHIISLDKDYIERVTKISSRLRTFIYE